MVNIVFDKRLNMDKIIKYLFPDQKPIINGTCSRSIYNGRVFDRGYYFLCDSTLVFVKKNPIRVYDYIVEKINGIELKKKWIFFYEAEILFHDSYYDNKKIDEMSIKILFLDRKKAEDVIATIKNVISKRKKIIDEKKSLNLVKYGVNDEYWGSIEDAKKWFTNYLIERGFYILDNEWMTEIDYDDLIKSKSGLMKYIKNGEEEWVPISYYIDEVLNPKSFEEFLGKLFENKGYKVTNLPHVKDFGLDLIVEKDNLRIGIQAKKYSYDYFYEDGPSHKVGSPDVQRALGSIFFSEVDKVIFITTTEFTDPAIEQTKNAPIELWDRDELLKQIQDQLPSTYAFFRSSSGLDEIYRTIKRIEYNIKSSYEPYIYSRIHFYYTKIGEFYECDIIIPLKLFRIFEYQYKKVIEELSPEYEYEKKSIAYYPGYKSRLNNGIYIPLRKLELQLILEHFSECALISRSVLSCPIMSYQDSRACAE